MKRPLCLASALALAAVSAAHGQSAALPTGPAPAPSTALLGNIDFAVDHDGVHVSGVRLGGIHACGSYLDRLGFASPRARVPHPGVIRDTATIARVLDRQATAAKGIEAEAAFVQAGGRTRLVGDATWSARPAPDTGVGLFAAGDLVATQPAIDHGIAYGFFGATAERTLVDGVVANGVAGYQAFTDGNERMHVRARLTWHVAPQYGIDAQFRWRRYESGVEGFHGAYFNPERYAQWQGVLDWHRRVGGWTISGALGAGQETIDGAGRHPVRSAQLRAEGTVADTFRVAVYARYNRSTDDFDVADHAHRQAGVTLTYPF